LGTRRVSTDYQGNITETCTSLPFGDGLSCSGPDPTEHHFTGKERDSESGNDYFGARYYASSMGRFLSPDWSAKVTPVPYAKLDNPQSLNLYAYVGNNPMTRFDPDGHFDCSGKNAQGAGCQYIANWNKEHGIDPSAKKSNAPGVPVKLPNGKTVPDSHSPTGVMMAPSSSVSDVAAAGKNTGNTVAALNAAGMPGTAAAVLVTSLGTNVGTGGTFDEQRMGPQSDVLTGGFQQLPQFRDASNFNVGLFAQQAGMSLDSTLQTAGEFAKHFSSNYSPDQPYGLAPQTAEFIRAGYQAGATAF
jgi:RHS repeat-associated protein